MIVSEERGDVCLAVDRKIQMVDTPENLTTLLKDAVIRSKDPETNIKERIISWITKRFQIKATVFALVFILWLALAGQQNFEKKIDIPLNFENIPNGLTVSEPVNPKISITCRGLRKDVSLLSKNNTSTSVDLFSAKPGTFYLNINTHILTLPNDRVHVVNMSPARVELTFIETPQTEEEDKPLKAEDTF